RSDERLRGDAGDHSGVGWGSWTRLGAPTLAVRGSPGPGSDSPPTPRARRTIAPKPHKLPTSKEVPVPNTRTRSLFGRRFLRHLWHLTRVYWSSPDGRTGALLYATAIAFELGTVQVNVILAATQRRIFDEIQTKAMLPFLSAVALFLGFALLFVLVSTYRIYVRQILEIRWRRWLTDHFLDEWMGSQAYYRMELHREHTDNPDQRI